MERRLLSEEDWLRGEALRPEALSSDSDGRIPQVPSLRGGEAAEGRLRMRDPRMQTQAVRQRVRQGAGRKMRRMHRVRLRTLRRGKVSQQRVEKVQEAA